MSSLGRQSHSKLIAGIRTGHCQGSHRFWRCRDPVLPSCPGIQALLSSSYSVHYLSAVFGSLQLLTSVFQKDKFLKVSNFAITANLEMDIFILAVWMFTNNLLKFMCT